MRNSVQVFGGESIMRERIRQQQPTDQGGEGYASRSDVALYGDKQLAQAALCYIMTYLWGKKVGYEKWPWKKNQFTFKPKDNRRNLERAGALIAAEIDRLNSIGELENG